VPDADEHVAEDGVDVGLVELRERLAVALLGEPDERLDPELGDLVAAALDCGAAGAGASAPASLDRGPEPIQCDAPRGSGAAQGTVAGRAPAAAALGWQTSAIRGPCIRTVSPKCAADGDVAV
jgi:hypothetical protein